MIIVTVDHLSINDLESAGQPIKAMAANGAVGLMNTGLYKNDALISRYLAMASGNRPVSQTNIEPEFRNAASLIGRVQAGEIFAFNTGRKASAGSVVCLNYQRIVREYGSESSFNSIDAGLIGDMLHKHGMKTAVIGNSSTFDKDSSHAPLIAADSFGYVDAGDVDSHIIMRDSENPCGVADDVSRLISGVNRYASQFALIVVQSGDLTRLEEYRLVLSDAAYDLGRERALTQLDHLIGGLLPVADQYNASLILVSSCRNRSIGRKYSNLAPVIVYQSGSPQSLLSSATTRTKGLISNIDIAPTILSAAGIAVSGSILGQPGTSVPYSDTISYLSKLDRLSADKFSIAVPVFISLGILLISAITICEFALRKSDTSKRMLRNAFYLSVAAICVPASLLIVDWIRAENFSQYMMRLILAIMFVMFATYLLARLISRSSHNFTSVHLAVILSITSLMFVVDILTGGRPYHWSILNCDYITGIRYYGIGNEYMGMFVGTAVMVPLVMLMNPGTSDDHRYFFNASGLTLCITACWFAFIAVVIGFPKLGANVGGLLTSIAAFSAAMIVISGIRLNYRHGLIIAAIAIIALIVFAAVDMYNTNSVSHLGRSLSVARSGGAGMLMELLLRKVMMHLSILTSPAAYLPILFGIPFLLMFTGRYNVKPAVLDKFTYIDRVVMPIIIAGVVVAFLFNDSGIVPSALLFGTFTASTIVMRLGGRLCE